MTHECSDLTLTYTGYTYSVRGVLGNTTIPSYLGFNHLTREFNVKISDFELSHTHSTIVIEILAEID